MNTERNTSFKYLAKNIGLLSISQFGTKLLNFFLVPLYTTVLTTAEYGTYDFFSTTVSLLIPVLTLNIMESILRFCLDKEQSPKEVFSVGFKTYLFSLVIVIALILVNTNLGLSETINEYKILFFLMYATLAFYQILSNFARGIDNVMIVSVGAVLLSATNIFLNIVFLLGLKIGLVGYFMASIIGNLVAIFYIVVRLKVWRYISIRRTDKKVFNSMIAYSCPLILTAVSWWINSASDRYVVIGLCGIAINGIYSVAYKIPSILNVFQSIFNQAWVLSAVKDFNKNDETGFFTEIYKVYHFVMIIACSIIIVATRGIASVLYANEFYEAWYYVPFLTYAVVFGAMSGYIGGIFSTVKDTKALSLTTVIGAVINIVLNLILVWLWGAIGAAIATLFSYYIVWKLRIVMLRKYLKLDIDLKKDYLAYLMLLIQSLMIMLIEQSAVLYIVLVMISVSLVLIYREECSNIVTVLKNKAVKVMRN